MEENNNGMSKKKKMCIIIGLIVTVLLIGGIIFAVVSKNVKNDNKEGNTGSNNVTSNSEKETEGETEKETEGETEKEIEGETEGETEKETEAEIDKGEELPDMEVDKDLYYASNGEVDMLDLYFMKVENKKKNMAYSPLSVKYALAMLGEGADGESKEQITNVLKDFELKKYTNSEKLSLANGFFINETYKDAIKESYINNLKTKYDAEVMIQSFDTPDSLNEWVKNKTFGMIENVAEDISEEDMILVNTLTIDMDWKEQFVKQDENGYYCLTSLEYWYYTFGWSEEGIDVEKFNDKWTEVVSLSASFNKYDIIEELGEEKIAEIITSEAEKYLKENPGEDLSDFMQGDTVDEQLESLIDDYIKEMDTYYMDDACSTEFSFYVDDDVKVLARDLEEKDGVQLQYIGIMPVKEDLYTYVNDVTSEDISNIISNLKEAKSENCKDGVITFIYGYFPKFNIDYELDLKKDLKKLEISNVFEEGKANLTNLADDEALYINDAKQKSHIEFNEYGIKASSVTYEGGLGGGGNLLYAFEPPIEEIDLTFDKPFMFIIRDKNTGETWYAGNVYEGIEREW